MKERIAEFIREQAYKPMSFAELAEAMGIPEKQHTQLQKTLEQMEATGEVVRTRLEHYGAPERMNLAVGRLQGHPKGFGFLVQDDPEAEDIFIGRENLSGAWHGDRIVARLSPPTRPGGRIEGEVIRILQRATQRVVGTYETAKNAGYVTPDDRRLPEDIFIPKGATNGAKSGEKVVVQIVEYPEARRSAEGRIVERLGMKGAVGVDIVSVIRKFGLPEAFPPRVLKEAEAVADVVPEEAAREQGRRDLRDWTIVTIDGEDAKDLDDAVNVERIVDGLWRVGVHIADVSYYVPEGSALDQEAYKRGTSVYLADRVVPMLPPKLSNGVCSLNPQVDRLTLSCVMEINRDGQVSKYEIFPSVIKTAARMTYAKVNEILAGDEAAQAEYRPLVPMFHEMLELMNILRAKRSRRGAIDFDLPEAKVKLNADGWPVEIVRFDRGVAERIIEEFMLAANETVAEHCHKREVPFMYRIHPEPAADRLGALSEFLGLFGYSLKLPRESVIQPRSLQAITEWAHGRTEENLINSVLLRTMKQASYSEANLGHFGLAADYYCHFTSPIRRYPDLVVHRVLRAMLSGALNLRTKHKWDRWMPDAARNASERERVAVEAERETVDLKKAEFMSDKVGESFEGIISGVSQFGFFVQLPNTVEGLVHVSTLTDDYYHFHDKFYALIGERTRRRFRLGDKVVVRLMRVDVESRQVDFALDMEQSQPETVIAVSGDTRNRAPKKRAFAGGMPEVAAATGVRPRRQAEPAAAATVQTPAVKSGRQAEPAAAATVQAPAVKIRRQVEPAAAATVQAPAEKSGRRAEPAAATTLQAPALKSGRQAEPAAAATVQAPAETSGRQAEPAAAATVQAPAETSGRKRKRRRGRKEAVAVEATPGATMAAPTLRHAAGERRAQVDEPARQRLIDTIHRRQQTDHKPIAPRSHRLDMWGVPVPGGRAMPRPGDADPGVINPFSINPPARERGGRVAKPPADATAGDVAASGEARGRARRPSRPRKPPVAKKESPESVE